MSRDVVIVGGNAGGMSTATRLRRLDEAATITVLERGDHVSYASCGLPYHLDGTIPEDELAVLTPEKVGGMFDLDVRTRHEVTGVDTPGKTVTVRTPDGTERLGYDSLVLAPGASPVEPPITGVDEVRTHSVRTIDDVAAIRERVDDPDVERALVVGGGYIGLEVTETLTEAGLSVTTAEMEPQVMPRTLGPAMAALVHNHLRDAGVDLRLGTIVDGLRAGASTTAVFADGGSVDVDLVVLAAGVRPRTELAEDAGLALHDSGAIPVDEQLRTSEPDVYALGDAVAVPAVGADHAWVPLGGPANRQGRVLGTVLAGRDDSLDPVLDTAVAKVFDLTVGSVGQSERRGGDGDLEKVYVYPPTHAEYYPDGERFWVKLLFDPTDGTVRGAQSVGRDGVDKRIDVIATAMQDGATVSDLAQLDLAYAPPYSSARDPVNVAGMAAENVVEGLVDIVHWHDLDDGEVPPLVDCRPPEMRAAQGHIPDALNVPLPELRDRTEEFPDEVVTYCKMGQTSYAAGRVLEQHGVRAQSLSGGYALYEALQRDRAARADPPLVADDD